MKSGKLLLKIDQIGIIVDYLLLTYNLFAIEVNFIKISLILEHILILIPFYSTKIVSIN